VTLLFILFSYFSFGKIKEYKYKNGDKICFKSENREFKIVREFFDNKIKKYLLVDTSSLNSKIINSDEVVKYESCSDSSKYQNLLKISSSPPYPLENDGIKNINRSGVVITTDLCPSSKRGFERRLYKSLINNFPNPVPVTVFITKKWIRRHKRDFNRLKNWCKNGKLSITWGNHTAYHYYFPRVPFKRNFVLSRRENLSKDILDLEIELIKDGVTPSIFFRFPGLVSDKKSVDEVKKLGLIIIGSDSWLAKDEKIKDGSIILVHGNKNEPVGVKLLIRAIKKGKIEKIKAIYDLNNSRRGNDNRFTQPHNKM
jgi:peptidoglycan/xylan/chitin deacetylase (PgdA/CDA1 family)